MASWVSSVGFSAVHPVSPLPLLHSPGRYEVHQTLWYTEYDINRIVLFMSYTIDQTPPRTVQDWGCLSPYDSGLVHEVLLNTSY